VLLFVAIILDIVQGEEVGFITLSGKGYLGFFLRNLEVGASCRYDDIERLFGWVSCIEKGTFDDVKIVVDYGETKD
jgi:hypothetical protein